jgi:hypothetical protein
MRYFQDRLGVLGAAAGAFLALVALATLAGRPWVNSGGSLVVQVVGCVATLAVGAGVAWVTNEARLRQYREGR